MTSLMTVAAQSTSWPRNWKTSARGRRGAIDRHTPVGGAQDEPQIAEVVGEANQFGYVVAQVHRVQIERRPWRQTVVKAAVEAVAHAQHAHLGMGSSLFWRWSLMTSCAGFSARISRRTSGSSATFIS